MHSWSDVRAHGVDWITSRDLLPATGIDRVFAMVAIPSMFAHTNKSKHQVGTLAVGTARRRQALVSLSFTLGPSEACHARTIVLVILVCACASMKTGSADAVVDPALTVVPLPPD